MCLRLLVGGSWLLLVACQGMAQSPSRVATTPPMKEQFGGATTKVVQVERVIPKVGVTDSEYDDIPSILAELNVSFQPTIVSDNPLAEFNVIYIGCESSVEFPVRGLREFVERGGVLYVSDHSNPVLEDAFAEYLPKFQEDGPSGIFDCEVFDEELIQKMGRRASVNFDKGGWAYPVVMSKEVKVLMSYTSPEGVIPVLVSFNYGKGRVIFTSFHNHARPNPEELVLIREVVMAPVKTWLKGKTTKGDSMLTRTLGDEVRRPEGPPDPTKGPINARTLAKMSEEQLLTVCRGTTAGNQQMIVKILGARRTLGATRALARAIDLLPDELKPAARVALEKRLASMTAENLQRLEATAEEVELRSAKAKALASKAK